MSEPSQYIVSTAMPQIPHYVPVIAVSLYCMYPASWRINGTVLYYFTILHNVSLACFSTWCFYQYLYVMYEQGFQVTNNYYYSNPRFERVMFYFYMSKYYEFIDTFLIYLNGKKPILLQTYHHIGTALTAHISHNVALDSMIIPSTMNSFVHMIMYSYYVCAFLKLPVRHIKPYITTMQLVQFFAIYSTLMWWDVSTYNQRIVACINLTFIAGLIVLFTQFFYRSYIRKIK